MSIENYIKHEKRVPVQFKLPESYVDKLDTMAEDLQTTRTTIIKAIIDKHFDEEYEMSPQEETRV